MKASKHTFIWNRSSHSSCLDLQDGFRPFQKLSAFPSSETAQALHFVSKCASHLGSYPPLKHASGAHVSKPALAGCDLYLYQIQTTLQDFNNQALCKFLPHSVGRSSPSAKDRIRPCAPENPRSTLHPHSQPLACCCSSDIYSNLRGGPRVVSLQCALSDLEIHTTLQSSSAPLCAFPRDTYSYKTSLITASSPPLANQSYRARSRFTTTGRVQPIMALPMPALPHYAARMLFGRATLLACASLHTPPSPPGAIDDRKDASARHV